jgi:hypothetical protein
MLWLSPRLVFSNSGPGDVTKHTSKPLRLLSQRTEAVHGGPMAQLVHRNRFKRQDRKEHKRSKSIAFALYSIGTSPSYVALTRYLLLTVHS